jgi:hypothetical protein
LWKTRNAFESVTFDHSEFVNVFPKTVSACANLSLAAQFTRVLKHTTVNNMLKSTETVTQLVDNFV